MKPAPQVAWLGIVMSTAALCAACGGGAATTQTPSTPVVQSTGALVDLSSLTSQEKEDRFIAAVGGVIGSMSREGIVSLGQRACGAFAEGSAVGDVRSIFLAKGLTEAQAQKVLLAAVATMCPEYADKVNP